MRALSIQQPWADLILYHGKDVENRTWKLPDKMLNQRIYIHASKRSDRDAVEGWGFLFSGSPPGSDRTRRGAILGEVTIAGCVTEHTSEWFEGPYGFVLADPVAYDTPIPCRGRLGFFRPEISTMHPMKRDQA